MFKLIRYQNLLFVVLIQLLVYGGIIIPTLASYVLPDCLSVTQIISLVISTVCITAGGYVINDYFDVKIDRINRPGKVLIGSALPKEQAMRFYQVLTLFGILFGLYLAFTLRSMTLGFVYIVVPGMLWFYSSSYKRMLLVGNIIVAFCSALVPLLPMLAMQKVLENNWGDVVYDTPLIKELYTWVGVIAVFAFVWTLIREIIKDIQDVMGDRELECHTVPVVWGETGARILVIVLTILADVALVWLATKVNLGITPALTLKYAVWGIVVPSVCLIGILLRKDASAPRQASMLCKFIMLIGTLYCLIYNFLMAQQYDVSLLGLFKLA
ncbi:MAG: geranylgeranylglycerol-phosphate geranylgeranyltransferase [Paludibacteraceae bacterium]|nr:geranylgeranylglycerol-phosphate geranylgeranyltransferase [Paludibacteraceae bacterium]